MQLHQEHADDIVPLTLSIDYAGDGDPEDLKPAIMKTLEKVGATGENVICTDSDAVMEAFGSDGVTSVRVYGRDGDVAKTFVPDDEFNYEEDVIPFVKTLLRKEKESSE